MNENKTTTYGELKCRKAELLNEFDTGRVSRKKLEEFRVVQRLIKQAEMWLLWTIVSLMLIIAGCNAIDGMRTDIHQWTDTPSHHQEK